VCAQRQFVLRGAAVAVSGLLFLLLAAHLPAQVPNLPGAGGTARVPLTDGAARIVDLSGQVSVFKKGDWWALMPDGIVSPGQEIMSGPDGHAILELQDTSRVEVFPNSRMIFRATRSNPKDLLDLILGKVRVHIEKLGGQPNPYRMNSPTAWIAVRGTTFEVSVTDPDAITTVAVEEGIVEVSHRLRPSSKAIRLGAGESLTVYPNEALTESHVDQVHGVVQNLQKAARVAIDVWQRTRTAGTATPGTVPGTTPGTTPAGNPTPTPVGSGNGTPPPPTNGRPGTGNGNGDTNPGTPTGPGSSNPPTNSGPHNLPAPVKKPN
jgi:hypothetical protein